MKTLFYPKHDLLEITDQQVPYMAKNEVLIKVAACGICGSELETFKSHSSRRVPPLIMGHEFSGVIVDVGESVADWKKGDRVVSNAIVPCGHCELCTSGKTNLCQNRQVFGMQRNGAFAEYVNVPAHCLIPLPEMVPFHAACLAEPLARRAIVKTADDLILWTWEENWLMEGRILINGCCRMLIQAIGNML